MASDDLRFSGIINDLGFFASEAALISAHPNGVDGQFAMIGSTDTFWVWDSDTVAWVDTSTMGGTGDMIGANNLSDVASSSTSLNNLGGEPSFSKNTAFNKNFGTSAGTVLEGDTTTISATQASDITANNAKVSNVTTNLSVGTTTATTLDVNSSDGTNATLPSAIATTSAGLLSGADKAKLDGITSGAEPNAVDSVNTQTGAVVLDADDISDAVTTNKFVTAGDLTVLGNTSGTNSGDEVSATEGIEGIAEIATQAETDTGTDDARFVTPLKLANYSGLGGGGDSICIPLGGNNASKAIGRNVTNQVVKEFIYKGATKNMTLVEVIVDRGLLASVTVEIFDYTNALSICSATTTTSGKLILNLGTISNLPAANAIFQLRVSTGTGGNNDDALFYTTNIEL